MSAVDLYRTYERESTVRRRRMAPREPHKFVVNQLKNLDQMQRQCEEKI